MQDTQKIVADSMRKLQEDPSLMAAAREDKEVALDRLGLQGIARQAVSAGITMATALISALTNIPVSRHVAMTGEITLSGRVLPVGGIKEQVLAARRMGIREVILPRQNEKDFVEDLTPEQRKDLSVHYVTSMDEVLMLALTPATRKGDVPRHEEARPRFSLA